VARALLEGEREKELPMRKVFFVSILATTGAFGVACGSSGSSGSAPDPGSTNDASTSSTETMCDHVVAAGYLGSAQALATDGTDVFVLASATAGDRLISVVKNGAIAQVADVPSDGTISLQTPALVVDADNFYVTAFQKGVEGIYSVPRSGGGAPILLATPSTNDGFQYPHFVSDGAYLYYKGSDADESLTRIPVGGGAEEIINGSSFASSGNFGGVTIAVDATSFYSFINGENAGEYDLTIVPKTPPAANGPQATPNYLTYTLGQCTSSSPSFAIGSSGFFAACTDNGSVPIPSIGNWLYALPTAAPNATNVASTTLARGATVDFSVFAAANGNVYYDDSNGDTAQPHVYKVAGSGGAPTTLMDTREVSRMLVMGSSLVVASGCGIQEIGL
jgi:hypothetical protein